MGLLSDLAAVGFGDFGPRWRHKFARAIQPLHGWKQSDAAMLPSRGHIQIFFC